MWIVTRIEGAGKHPWKRGMKAGVGQCSLVLGAVCGHSADEGLDSSLVAGAHLGSRGKAVGRQV